MRSGKVRKSDKRARSAKQSTLNAPPRERAFLVGIEYKRQRSPSSKRVGPPLTAGAQAARDSATSISPGTKVVSAREFSAEESLAELRSLAESAGAQVVGEFLQHRDKPDRATLIGKGKLEEIAGAAASVSPAGLDNAARISPAASDEEGSTDADADTDGDSSG